MTVSQLQGRHLKEFTHILEEQALQPLPPQNADENDEIYRFRMVRQRVREEFFSHVLQGIREIPDVIEAGISRSELIPIMNGYKPNFSNPLERLVDHPELLNRAQGDMREAGAKKEGAFVVMPSNDPNQAMRNLKNTEHNLALMRWNQMLLNTHEQLLALQSGKKPEMIADLKASMHEFYDGRSAERVGTDYLVMESARAKRGEKRLLDDLIDARMDEILAIYTTKIVDANPGMQPSRLKITVQEELSALAKENNINRPQQDRGFGSV